MRHFYTHTSGFCELCGLELEDLPHILLPKCPHLQERADILKKFAINKLSSTEVASNIFSSVLESKDRHKVQFFLDPSVVPMVIAAQQVDSTILPLLFSVTTTWCYSLNRTRLKLLEKG